MKLTDARELTERLESIRLHVSHLEVKLDCILKMVAQLHEQQIGLGPRCITNPRKQENSR